MNFLSQFSRSAWYWLGLLLLTITLEGTALYFQYYLEELPCLLCIHVRIIVLGLFVVALYGLFARCCKWSRSLAHFLVIGFSLGLLERAWQLYSVENGEGGLGSCTMELGLPSWFALDKWLPSVFEVKTTCGYTPELLFQVTMAESLLVLSAVLAIMSIVLFLTTLFDTPK